MLLLPALCLGSVTSQVDKSGPFLITSLPQVVPTGFPFQQASDLVVLDEGSTAIPRDPASILSFGSDYTVTGGGYNSANQMQVGSIVVSAGGSGAVLTNDQLVIMRGVPINQVMSFISTGPLTISLLEQALDKEATLSQQVNEVAGRSLQFENFETASPLLNKLARVSKYLAFDSNGNVIFLTGTGSVPADASLSLVTATGSTTPRDLAVRFSEVVNIRDFGAVGDGSTDDTAAVQAALNYVAANNQFSIYAPEGTYVINGVTFAASGTQQLVIRGSGAYKTIFKAKSGAGDLFTFSGPMSRCVFSDWSINGSTGTGNGIYYSSTGSPNFLYQSRFDNMVVENCAKNGIYIKSSFANKFTNVNCGANGWNQFKVWGQGTTDIFERCDIGSVSSTFAGFRVLDGGTYIGCNGIYAAALGPMYRLGGDGSADSDGITDYPNARIIGTNIEGITTVGVEVVSTPISPILIEGALFTTAAGSANVVGINMLNSSTNQPMLLSRCSFGLGSGSTWKNGFAIHGQMPVASTDIVTGQTAIQQVYNDAGPNQFAIRQTIFGQSNPNASPYLYQPNQTMGYTEFEYLASYGLGNPNFSSDYITVISAPAMPSSGSFRQGDIVYNCSHSITQLGSSSSKYTLLGWRRLTTGSANILNTDWVEMRCLTGN